MITNHIAGKSEMVSSSEHKNEERDLEPHILKAEQKPRGLLFIRVWNGQ